MGLSEAGRSQPQRVVTVNSAARAVAAIATRFHGPLPGTPVATEAATFGGTDFRTFMTGGTSSVTIFMMIACAEDPVCGGSPVSISYSTQPNE